MFEIFYRILVAGGDSLVGHVIDRILKKVQSENNIVLGGKESLQACSIPIGVIPCGSSNIIAHTIHGTSDMVTAALDIVYGRSLCCTHSCCSCVAVFRCLARRCVLVHRVALDYFCLINLAHMICEQMEVIELKYSSTWSRMVHS